MAVCQIDDAVNPFDPTLMHASDWFSSHLSQAIVPFRSHGTMYRANGMDDSNSSVGLWNDNEKLINFTTNDMRAKCVAYLHRLTRLQRLHSMGCQRCACTCNSFHNLVADCHHCKIALAECHVFAKAWAMAVPHTIFRQSMRLSDRHRVPLKSDCMCLAGTVPPVDRNRIGMVGRFWRRDARRVHLCPFSSHSSNCSRISHLIADDHTPHPMDSIPARKIIYESENIKWTKKLEN